MTGRLLLSIACSLWLFSQSAWSVGYDLEAPSQAHSRQDIDVTWAMPEGARGLLEIRPRSGAQGRVSYAYTQRNPQTLLAPEQPGDYELVLVVDGSVQASRPLTVVLPEASVEVPATADAGASVDVVWSGPVSRNDRLTFAERGGAPLRGASYVYVGNLRGGPGTLRAPADAGAYDVVYVSGETVLARAPIQVGDVSATLTVPAQVHAGGPLPVRWDGPANEQDSITFASRAGAPLKGASYTYVRNHETNQATLTAGETPGDYDVVYVSSGRVIGRAPVRVTDAVVELDAPAEVDASSQFRVRWQGAGNQGDRIQLKDADETLVAYGYVDPNDPEVVLVAPSDAGAHALVYLSRGGRELARRALDVLPPAVEPGQLLVEQGRAALGPNDAVGLILDASGSMLQRIDGERRIAIARDTLTALVRDDLPAGVGFALRVFGHREPGSCRTDLELPLGPLDPAATAKVIAGIDAMNLAKTPLGRSIALAVEDLNGVSGRRVVVVVTDGEETCDGDPAAAIQRLRDLGWDLRLNIVGLAIDDPSLAERFRAWAALGNGDYFSAEDREQLGQALREAVASPYEVRAVPGGGELVATGQPGTPLTLPPGKYRLHGEDGRSGAATVIANETTKVALD
jgi:hypothetical protein